MSACGCEPGKPARCAEGKALEERETNAQVQRVALMHRRASDPDRIAAAQRLQETRYAVLRHMSGEG